MLIDLTPEEVTVLRNAVSSVIRSLTAVDKSSIERGREPQYVSRIEERKALLAKLNPQSTWEK